MGQMGQTQSEEIFKFWKAIEALTPQKLDKENQSDRILPSYNVAFDGDLPWNNLRHLQKPLPAGKIWRYTVQYGVYSCNDYANLLHEKIGQHEDVVVDSPGGKSRLFDLQINEKGLPVPESFILSLAAWATGQVLQHEDGLFSLENSTPADLSDLPVPNSVNPTSDSGFRDFDELVHRLTQLITSEAARLAEDEKEVSLIWFSRLTKLICRKIHLPLSIFDEQHACSVKCFQVNEIPPQVEDVEKAAADQKENKPQAAPDDLLNSFFIRDLAMLAKAWGKQNVGRGLVEYVTATGDTSRPRIDIRSAQGLKTAFQCVLPTQHPPGCWPSEHPLAFSQQLAVNEIWRQCAGQSGIFAVNGPPGTGKTTLLRDVVAAIVTERAQALTSTSHPFAQKKTAFKLGDSWLSYYPQDSNLHGFSIVVASANNGAVENISLELPGISSVPKRTLAVSDYFSELSSEILGKPAWGLLAARLGNKANRDSFMNTFWWRKPGVKNYIPPATFTPKNKEGLAFHLGLIANGTRKPTLSWKDAVERFQAAMQAEITIRNELIAASKLHSQIDTLSSRINEIEPTFRVICSQINKLQIEKDQVTANITSSDSTCENHRLRLDDVIRMVKHHQSYKPGVLAWISTFGSAHKQWWDRYQNLTTELDCCRQAIREAALSLQHLKTRELEVSHSIQAEELHLNPIREELDGLNLHRSELYALQSQAKESLGDGWPNPTAADDKRELSAPWSRPDWHAAREAVFLAALDVHRAFIENNPAQVISNINLASDWLQGKELPEDAAAAALGALCLIVPVVSTTFASIPRMFRQIRREKIGWLLVDEAGQALPQQAAGAIWRSARTVVVGDPKQLEPVSGLPSTIEGGLAKHYGVEPHWWPSETSAQVLADQTMNMGTYLPDTDDDKVWVGSPLRVHRRCDDPMFGISNQIAYDGLMVHGKKSTAIDLPPSCWIDVQGKTGEGNWIPEEGVAVRTLLDQLSRQHSVSPDNIFLISPFRDCAKMLTRLAVQYGLDSGKTGTVHTTQGKESAIVVLVLGGNPQKPGAKGWAARRPNLLNVAVSRAKQRLYVIGDRAAWQKQRYFSKLAFTVPESQSVWPALSRALTDSAKERERKHLQHSR